MYGKDHLIVILSTFAFFNSKRTVMRATFGSYSNYMVSIT